MHVRNVHNTYLDYNDLAHYFPALRPFLTSKYGRTHLDYKDPVALKTLTQALLAHFYKLQCWDLPAGFLLPPIPQRVNYVHYVADLLRPSDSSDELQFSAPPIGPQVRVLDIGTGASGIYCFLATKVYRWRCIGTDIDQEALTHVRSLVSTNGLEDRIQIREQTDPCSVFEGVVKKGERFAVCVCNPPFHENASFANSSTATKWHNLQVGGSESSATNVGRNYGGRQSEIVCQGGEVAFIRRMVQESAFRRDVCIWFTSLVARQSTLRQLPGPGEVPPEWRVTRMVCGNNVKWHVCWSWMSKSERSDAVRALYIGSRLSIEWPTTMTPTAPEKNTANVAAESETPSMMTTFVATVTRVKKRKVELLFDDDGEYRWTRLRGKKHRWI